MQTSIYLDANLVPRALRAGYDGKKFKARVCERVTIPMTAGLWSGGSRDTYSLVEFETGREMAASDNMSAPWNPGRKDREIELKPGFCVVEHSIFCGRDMGLTFYVHPDNAAKLLPAPVAELSAHEKIVLDATAGLKSSYMGKDRFQMSSENSRFSRYSSTPFAEKGVHPTREQWDAAKALLISKGLLNKAGAITVAGRNARGGAL